MKEEDRPKTAFVLPFPWDRFQWNRMTFGLLDAAFTLSAAIGTTLDEYKEYAGAYYDDMIVHSPDLETHFQQVDAVLDKLAERGLRINYAKCEFIKQSVKFVGLTLSGAGISPSRSRSR